jgi:hypothetical protein
MKKILVLLFCVVISSCTQPKYEHIGQTVINGKVSAVREGGTGRVATSPRIWVQNPTETVEVEIPFELEGKWKVGDSCLLIVEKYKEIPYEK